MRNCFVPQCDAYCKQNKITKRMMFIPPREESVFNVWRSKLFNKRMFRRKDKVCERHFAKEQIMTHWDHTINGKIVQLKREKPKLKSTAIPTLNLPEMFIPAYNADELDDVNTKTKTAKTRQQRKRPYVEAVEDEGEASEKDPEDEVARIDDENINDDEMVLLQLAEDQENNEESGTCDSDKATFDSLYDDIFEVVLPSTLWGIHRDPERKFIAFSEFDVNTMTAAKLLYVSASLDIKTYLYSMVVGRSKRTDLTVDLLTEKLAEMDEYRTCITLRSGINMDGCLMIATDGDCCNNCSKNVIDVKRVEHKEWF